MPLMEYDKTNKQTNKHARKLGGRREGWIDGGRKGGMDRWMDGGRKGGREGGIDGWMVGGTEGWREGGRERNNVKKTEKQKICLLTPNFLHLMTRLWSSSSFLTPGATGTNF